MAEAPPNHPSQNGRLFPVVFEDADFLVINKPAGLVCHPTKGDVYSSLISRIRLYFGGESEAHLINRLDRETSGLVVVAKHADAARELRRVWEDRRVEKEYLAIVHGHVEGASGTLDFALGRDTQSEVAVKDCVREDGASARTRYRVAARFERLEGAFSLLWVYPETGRKHQIRIHLSAFGHPIVGDKLYGHDESAYLAFAKGCLSEGQRRTLILPWQALHARSLALEWRATRQQFYAQPEDWFDDFMQMLPVKGFPF